MTNVAQNNYTDCVDYLTPNASENGKEDEKYLRSEILQLKNILATLTMKYKIAEDSRRVMTRRNSILFDDNQFLQDKLLDVEGRRILAEKEAYDNEQQVKKLEDALKMFMSEGREGVKKVMKSSFIDVSTSSTDLVTAETPAFCKGCIAKKDTIPDVKTPPDSIFISGEDIHRIDEDMIELKGALQKREEACSKIWERERNNRNKILKMNQEIQNLKNLNSWKSNELDFRTRELKIKEMELNDARKELLRLQGKAGPAKPLANNSNINKVKLTLKKKGELPANALVKTVAAPVPRQPIAKSLATLPSKKN